VEINIAKIEKERERQKLTRSELARLIGISRQAYSRFIRTRSTKLSTLTKIARTLDFDPKDLLK
jgi:transcriptional regulator with XRE-family HTH domain